MKTIVICGSLKFQKEMMEIAEVMELKGNLVITLIYPTRDDKDAYTEEEMNTLNSVHLEKIKIADAILVVDVGGYIGSSTKREIEFAKSLNKEVIYYTDLVNVE